jgi:hypothetical protein
MIENRKMERYRLSLKAKVMSAEVEDGSQSLEVLTRDVSSCGAFFLTPTPLPVGTTVRVDLLLRIRQRVAQCLTRPLLKMTGSVIRCENGGMAVSFDPNQRFAPLPA